MDYTFLLAGLENVLGKGHKKARDNYAFTCPKCNHRKQKLEINLAADENGHNYFACWVCGFKGTTIRSLLRQLKVPVQQAKEILKYTKKGDAYSLDEEDTSVELPKEYQPLATASTTSVVANMVRKYLYERGLTDFDFIKYSIGYTTTGDYGGRIIVPSYSGSNQLNYFVGRSYEGAYHKYKNPRTNKDIIFFENQINWNLPIVLCEGVFDAIAIRRNAIPILGKTLSKALIKKIITSEVEEIYIALDADAINRSLEFCEQFQKLGKKVYLINLTDKDPSELGFKAFADLMYQAEELNFSSLMAYKLDL